MVNEASLAADVDAFAATVDDLRGIAGRSDRGRRVELVALRRQLAERIVRMRDTGVHVLLDPAISNEFRSRLSHVLNLMALHQAKWPAVSIDDNDEYRQSAQKLADANRAFIDWIRAVLARLD